jgi:uncharacterized protein Yka (UPF0111/DUF47 family)
MFSFFKKYILPEEIDFFEAMKIHSNAIKTIIIDLQKCFIYEDKEACLKVLNDEANSKEIKKQNMKKLLSTFITPVDRESIYRVTTQLDWIAISTRHLILEVNSYKIETLKEYNLLFQSLVEMAQTLYLGFVSLQKKDVEDVDMRCENIRDMYDKAVKEYILYMSELAKQSNINKIFTHQQVLFQLKDIAKHFHLCANSLEDIVAKVV